MMGAPGGGGGHLQGHTTSLHLALLSVQPLWHLWFVPCLKTRRASCVVALRVCRTSPVGCQGGNAPPCYQPLRMWSVTPWWPFAPWSLSACAPGHNVTTYHTVLYLCNAQNCLKQLSMVEPVFSKSLGLCRKVAAFSEIPI